MSGHDNRPYVPAGMVSPGSLPTSGVGYGRRRRPPTRQFTAFWDSECTECFAPIYEGDTAGYVDGVDGVHCSDCLSTVLPDDD